MRTVLLIGAGGSLAQAESYRKRRKGIHPPLDGDFFTRCTSIGKTRGDVSRRIKSLTDALTVAPGVGDPFDPVPLPMEQFFADVYYEVAGRRNAAAFEVFVSLMRLYSVVLATTTNWMADRSDAGILDRLIGKEITRADPDKPTIITFNQDLVIENAIARLTRRGPSWCLSALYSMPTLSPLFAPAGQPVFRHHDSSCMDGAPVVLLKLHGSLNWGTRSLNALPSAGSVFPQGRRKTVFLQNRRLIEPQSRMRTHVRRGRNRWYLWPLIVPPIYDKQRITGMNVLQALWDSAAGAIEQTERLVMVGYSLPESDILARQLLRRAYAANSGLTSVEIVNPNPDVGPKVQRILGAKVVRVYQDIESYIDS